MNHNHSYFSEDRRIAKEINLKELYRVVKKRYWIILVITVLTTIAGWYYSHLNKPEPLYESSTNIIIGADSEYRKTLQVIIKDTIVLETVISNLGLDQSSKSLANQISVESIDNSQVVKISVIDTNPERAANIANMAAKVFKDEIPNILGFEEVQILSEARINPIPVNDSNPNKLVVAAFIIGIIIGSGLIFLIDSLDDSIKSERDIETVLGIQVLGSISKINNKNVRKKKGQKTKLAFRGETVGFK